MRLRGNLWWRIKLHPEHLIHWALHADLHRSHCTCKGGWWLPRKARHW